MGLVTAIVTRSNDKGKMEVRKDPKLATTLEVEAGEGETRKKVNGCEAGGAEVRRVERGRSGRRRDKKSRTRSSRSGRRRDEKSRARSKRAKEG
jgi:hypothetical protein